MLVDNAFLFGDGYIPDIGDNSTKQFAKAISSDPTLHSVRLVTQQLVTTCYIQMLRCVPYLLGH